MRSFAQIEGVTHLDMTVLKNLGVGSADVIPLLDCIDAQTLTTQLGKYLKAAVVADNWLLRGSSVPAGPTSSA